MSYAQPTYHELLRLAQDHMTRHHHKLLHVSWVTIDLTFEINFSQFISSIDPLSEYLLSRELSSPAFFRSPSTSTLSCYATSTSPMSLFNVLLQEQPPSTDPSAPLDMPIVIDTGASVSLTPILSDFISPLVPTQLTELKGLTSKTNVVGKGLVEWPIRDYWNVPGVITTSAYYVPNASIRLFSPQSYFQEHDNQGRCVIHG
jgi:hypothetical protein